MKVKVNTTIEVEIQGEMFYVSVEEARKLQRELSEVLESLKE